MTSVPITFAKFAATAAPLALKALTSTKYDPAKFAGEIPSHLLSNPKFVLIYGLPKILEPLGFRVGARMQGLWQYGIYQGHKLAHSSESKGQPYLAINPAAFSGLSVVNVHLGRIVNELTAQLGELKTADGRKKKRWMKLLQVASQEAVRHKEESWEQPIGNYLDRLYDPDVAVESHPVGIEDYVINSEDPWLSDTFFALGGFAIRTYVRGVLRKKEKDKSIYFVPVGVAARVYDRLHFEDRPGQFKLYDRFLSGVDSQFLGYWKSASADGYLTLTNQDFESFKEEFVPDYNKVAGANGKPLLKCIGFDVFSTPVELQPAAAEIKLIET